MNIFNLMDAQLAIFCTAPIANAVRSPAGADLQSLPVQLNPEQNINTADCD